MAFTADESALTAGLAFLACLFLPKRRPGNAASGPTVMM
jgi:hypothetical protein